MYHNLCLLNGALNPILTPKDLCQLLQGPVFRLHEEEVDEGELEDVPDTSKD